MVDASPVKNDTDVLPKELPVPPAPQKQRQDMMIKECLIPARILKIDNIMRLSINPNVHFPNIKIEWAENLQSIQNYDGYNVLLHGLRDYYNEELTIQVPYDVENVYVTQVHKNPTRSVKRKLDMDAEAADSKKKRM
jgi:hypothetical protein